MSIVFDESSKTFSVSYSKRNPKTGSSIQLKRIKIKSKIEAKRVYDELVIQVNDRIMRQIIPSWPVLLDSYFESLRTENLTNTTMYNREKVIRLHTLAEWQDKRVDQISTQDIFQLLNSRLGSNAESHRKFFIKCIKGVFQYALEKEYILRNPTPL
jgi:integrase